jgi:mycoredoxin
VTPEVVFYTRPGCPYSFRLRRALRRNGLPFREIDIWRDAAAAAAVREVARGNETVPTIHVGRRWLVNPTSDEVCAVAGYRPPDRPRGRVCWRGCAAELDSPRDRTRVPLPRIPTPWGGVALSSLDGHTPRGTWTPWKRAARSALDFGSA